MRIALGLQYDGSPYSGWQSQVNQNTIQDELEKAISAFVGIDALKSNPIRVITAGRTDTGVHALGQVVHFDVEVERENWSWVRGVNAFLPESIVVNWAQAVSEEFSARYSAHERT
jgi:tRNA pseudouridine38-40 synthase